MMNEPVRYLLRQQSCNEDEDQVFCKAGKSMADEELDAFR